MILKERSLGMSRLLLDEYNKKVNTMSIIDYFNPNQWNIINEFGELLQVCVGKDVNTSADLIVTMSRTIYNNIKSGKYTGIKNGEQYIIYDEDGHMKFVI